MVLRCIACPDLIDNDSVAWDLLQSKLSQQSGALIDPENSGDCRDDELCALGVLE